MAYRPEPPHTHGAVPKTAVVLVNLGTPDAPTAQAVKRYLKEFLSDPRVVEIPRAVWWLILNLVILPFRSSKSAAKYASIWTKDGSPLKVHTQKQANLLRGALGERGHDVKVVMAMRYGSPSLPEVLDQLKAEQCERVAILPAYPQYSGTTTGSINDAVFAHYRQVRNVPALRIIRNYHDHDGYIGALRDTVLAHWEQDGRGDHLVLSFHGVPRRTRLPRESAKDGAPAGAQAGPAAGAVHRHFPVALRQGRMAAAVHRADPAANGQGRRQAGRPDLSRLYQRLPGNAGRDQHRSTARLHCGGRARVPLNRLPEPNAVVDLGPGPDHRAAGAGLADHDDDRATRCFKERNRAGPRARGQAGGSLRQGGRAQPVRIASSVASGRRKRSTPVQARCRRRR